LADDRRIRKPNEKEYNDNEKSIWKLLNSVWNNK
jgi:hypothetical protein